MELELPRLGSASHREGGTFCGGVEPVHSRLRPGGVFALWSDAPPSDEFLGRLRAVFATAEGHLVTFPNPLIDGESSNSVYVATT